MTEEDVKLLEELMIAFTGDDERFAITNQSLRVLAEDVARRLRADDAETVLPTLRRAAAAARRSAINGQAGSINGPSGPMPLLRETDAHAMLLACPKNHPGM